MHGKKNNILLKWIRRKIDQFLPKKRILSWDNSCTRAITTEKQQNCSHKTWYMHIEIVCIGINKKGFVSVLRKNKLCHVLLSWFSGWVGKTASRKRKKCRLSRITIRYVYVFWAGFFHSWVEFFYSLVGFFSHWWKTSSVLFSNVFLPKVKISFPWNNPGYFDRT